MLYCASSLTLVRMHAREGYSTPYVCQLVSWSVSQLYSQSVSQSVIQSVSQSVSHSVI